MGDLNATRASDLVCLLDLTRDLLKDGAEVLPDDLRVGLDTFRCDVLAAIEDRADDITPVTAEGPCSSFTPRNDNEYVCANCGYHRGSHSGDAF
jgi:hypothetical protein